MKNQVLRYVAIAVFGFASLVAGWVLAVGVAVNPGGITFPDGTFQTTAASNWNPADSFFLEDADADMADGVDGQDWVLVDVPEGITAVLEYVSVHCNVPFTSDIPIVHVAGYKNNAGGGLDQAQFNIPLSYHSGDGTKATYLGGINTRLYCDSGQTILARLSRLNNSGPVRCFFDASGHFVPIPPEA